MGNLSRFPAAGRIIAGMLSLFARLLKDDSGQDLIEYGLIASIIGISGWLVFPGIINKIAGEFKTGGVQDNVNGLWVPNDPQ